jgi:hypothetical protein
VATPPMSPIGAAAIRAPATEWMNSRGTIWGIATTVPQNSRVFSKVCGRPLDEFTKVHFLSRSG